MAASVSPSQPDHEVIGLTYGCLYDAQPTNFRAQVVPGLDTSCMTRTLRDASSSFGECLMFRRHRRLNANPSSCPEQKNPDMHVMAQWTAKGMGPAAQIISIKSTAESQLK
ncbi:hypothetical protein PG985_005020 [Apiospora marii]|uniref:Polyketide synthase n=1 Tax=Apiospora marii TaxID=335849 RepID=A0ABR1SAM4_9PEZI